MERIDGQRQMADSYRVSLDSVRGLREFRLGISVSAAYSVYSYARLFGSRTLMIWTRCGKRDHRVL